MHIARRLAGLCLVALMAAVTVVASVRAQTAPAVTSIVPPADVTDPVAVANVLWTQCLGEGRQAVLYPDKWTCTKKQDGETLLHELAPDKFDPAVACKYEQGVSNDLRRMPTGLLQQLKPLVDANLGKPNDHTRDIQRNGIRIVGAAFCKDELSLTDFTLAVPLNLDRSVLKFGLRARNIRIAGNLSFAGSHVHDNFDISDSKIAGTLFGNTSFMTNIRIANTEVQEIIRFDRSVLVGYFMLLKATARQVHVQDSRISTFVVRQSTIAERLNLENSESACKYQIEKSDLNEVRAINIGFGKTTLSGRTLYGSWNRPYSPAPADKHPSQDMLKVKPVADAFQAPVDCRQDKVFFTMSEGSARSVCVLNFNWPVPASTGNSAAAELSFVNLTSIGILSVDLWTAASGNTPADNRAARSFEIAGTKIGALFFDYDDNARPYTTSIEQITIDRVHAARGDCGSYGNVTRAPTPDSSAVSAWLRKNTSSSLQPYTAFVKAFENAGEDATDLKANKADVEFHRSWDKYWSETTREWRSDRPFSTSFRILWQNGWHLPADLIAFGTKWLLGFIADYGFRPAQVLWTVIGIVALSWLVFWLFIRVVAFEMAKKAEMRVVGFAFLFDRLLPVYKLRDDHYDVGVYFQRGAGEGEKTIRYFGRPVTCTPASPRRVRCTEIYLDFLKLLGIVLAAFLVAAVNALIAR